jgi:hypothetical protein
MAGFVVNIPLVEFTVGWQGLWLIFCWWSSRWDGRVYGWRSTDDASMVVWRHKITHGFDGQG